MRFTAALTAALLGACGDGGGGDGARLDPVVDGGPRADRPSPAPIEDAFRPGDRRPAPRWASVRR